MMMMRRSTWSASRLIRRRHLIATRAATAAICGDQCARMPDLFGRIGVPAITALHAYIADRTRWAYGRLIACDALQKVAEQHPERRAQVIETLSAVLRDAEHDHELANTGAMGALMDLKAVEVLPLVRQVFERGWIDETMYGAWDMVLVEFGVKPVADDPLIAESIQPRSVERRARGFTSTQRAPLEAALARNTRRNLYGDVYGNGHG